MEQLKDILDITTGFVLNQRQALEYLKECAGEAWTQGTTGEMDSENAWEIIADLLVMAREVEKDNWEWVRFYECPMSASGINVKEVVDK